MRRPAEDELSKRDITILGFVAEVGVASTRQLERLAFPAAAGSSLSAARRARRVLARLHEDGYLGRLERRLGGVRAGSSGYLYQLGSPGKRVLNLTGRGRSWQPGERFVRHCLAVVELHVGLVEAERAGQISTLTISHEPDTWRRFTTASGVETLKPDLLVELTTTVKHQPWRLRWFVEVDRATEHLPTVMAKCQLYQRYWQSGLEAERYGQELFPRVLWSVPDQRRAVAISVAIRRRSGLTTDLFRVATAERSLAVLGGEGTGEISKQLKGGDR